MENFKCRYGPLSAKKISDDGSICYFRRIPGVPIVSAYRSGELKPHHKKALREEMEHLLALNLTFTDYNKSNLLFFEGRFYPIDLDMHGITTLKPNETDILINAHRELFLSCSTMCGPTFSGEDTYYLEDK